MEDVDRAVEEVAAEGEGSTRTLQISMDRGRFFYDNSSNSLVYELETDAGIISPQSSRKIGDITISSNANVEVRNATVSGTDCYMMENEHVKACIRRIPETDPLQDINTSNLLVLYEFKDQDNQLDANMTVELNGIANTSYGKGYTEPAEFGSFIGTGQVRAKVNSQFGYSYDVVISLPTGSDFLKVDVTNFS